ncbi:MAG: ankyrin repeat domain-containing protein [Holosporaceae bacterium]|jgi:hypothetical protein|nr:ankyrin repeat domain-containing protein [Holosporaceae bacterium]
MEKNQYITGVKILLSAVAILSTIEKGNSIIVVSLYGFPIPIINLIDTPSVCLATELGEKDRVKDLIEKYRKDINEIGQRDGWCALHYAIERDVWIGDLDMVKFLVEECGARVERNDCYSPIDFALQYARGERQAPIGYFASSLRVRGRHYMPSIGKYIVEYLRNHITGCNPGLPPPPSELIES